MRSRASSLSCARLYGLVASVMILLAAGRAVAQDSAAKITKLNKQGLDAFDNLNFDQSKELLEQALAEADTAGLASDPVAARAHLNLGMLLIAGFQQRDQAVEQFKAALKIQPGITAPSGLFNPEVQAAFDETKANLEKQTEAAKPPPKVSKSQTAPQTKTQSKTQAKTQSKKTDSATDVEGEAESEGGEEEAPTGSTSPFFLSLGLGSGFGVAKGHLDANKDIAQGTTAGADNSWAGGLAPSRLGHIMLGAGYFVSPDLLLSLEGRIQVVTGTTPVSGTMTATPGVLSCVPSCSPPSTGIAVMAKANWYFSPAPLRPFVSGGIGAGNIRQVVTLNLKSTPSDPTTHCGAGGNQPCVDTVTGGPVLLAAGGGLAYEMGSLVLLGSLTSFVGVPHFMFNIDLLLGLGVRL
jgi:hypothetical protein